MDINSKCMQQTVETAYYMSNLKRVPNLGVATYLGALKKVCRGLLVELNNCLLINRCYDAANCPCASRGTANQKGWETLLYRNLRHRRLRPYIHLLRKKIISNINKFVFQSFSTGSNFTCCLNDKDFSRRCPFH